MDGPTMIASSGGSCLPGLGLLRPAMDPHSVSRSVSPIGFEATMNVAMKLENELKTEGSQTGYASTPKNNGDAKLAVPKLELEGSEGGSPRVMEELLEEEDDVDSLCPSTMRSNGSFDGELSPGMPSVDNSKEGEEDADPFHKINGALERNGLQTSGNGLNGSGRPDSSEGDYYEGSESSQHHLYRHQGPDTGGPEDPQQPLHCHLCTFITHSKFLLQQHLGSHYDHKCNHCDYTSRTEGRLKRHLKDFHEGLPADDFPLKSEPSAPPSKAKTYRCKQCSYVATVKTDFWEHSKSHIKAEKLLTCRHCQFVTEYKHHMEYHLRNHFGSKPFKCPKCNYSCVNKSMLNSHMKSHSNVYQYRCANCTYATKYCHSLKLHLRKYAHAPATVLNADGTPNPVPVIDVYGTRRGPRTKKAQEDGHNGSNFSPLPGALSPSAFFYKGVQAGFHPNPEGHLHPRSLALGAGSTGSAEEDEPRHSPNDQGPFKCNLCDFAAEHRDTFSKHMLLHAASDNQDLCNLYGISSDSLLQDPGQQQPHSQMEAVVAVAAALGLNAQQQQAHRADLFRQHAISFLHLQNNQEGQNFAFHKAPPEEPPRRSPQNPLEHLRAFSEQITAKPYMMREFSSNLFGSPTNGADNPPRTSPALNGSAAKTPARQPPKGPKGPTADNHASFVPLDLSSAKGPRPPGPMGFPYHAPLQQFPFAQQLQRYPAFLPQPQTSPQVSPQVSPQALEICTNAASPEALPSPNQAKNRRKGKAFKLDRICMKLHRERETVGQMVLTDDSMEDGEVSKNSDAGEDCNKDLVPEPKNATPNNDSGFESNDKPKLSPVSEDAKCEDVSDNDAVATGDANLNGKAKDPWAEAFQCPYCDMAFKDCAMYTLHMGYHDYKNPFKCNMCGHQTEDKVAFFLHIARTAHR